MWSSCETRAALRAREATQPSGGALRSKPQKKQQLHPSLSLGPVLEVRDRHRANKRRERREPAEALAARRLRALALLSGLAFRRRSDLAREGALQVGALVGRRLGGAARARHRGLDALAEVPFHSNLAVAPAEGHAQRGWHAHGVVDRTRVIRHIVFDGRRRLVGSSTGEEVVAPALLVMIQPLSREVRSFIVRAAPPGSRLGLLLGEREARGAGEARGRRRG